MMSWLNAVVTASSSRYLHPQGTPLGQLGWEIIFGGAALLAESCSKCQDAESLMIFAKDLINVKKSQPIFDKDNFAYWLGIAQAGLSHSYPKAVTREVIDIEHPAD
jgi:hypothetical protein